MFSCFAFPASRRVTVHLKLFRPFKSLLSCFLQRFHRTYIWLGNPIGIACFTFALALFFNSLSLTFALVLLFHSLSFQACPYSCINSYKFYVYSQHRANVFQRTGARIDTTAANGDAGCLAVELPSRHGRPAHDQIYLSAQLINISAPVCGSDRLLLSSSNFLIFLLQFAVALLAIQLIKFSAPVCGSDRLSTLSTGINHLKFESKILLAVVLLVTQSHTQVRYILNLRKSQGEGGLHQTPDTLTHWHIVGCF